MTLAVDKDGFLLNLEDWNPEVAAQLAQQENLTLSSAHWEVIDALRLFYSEFQLSPAMRPFTKYLKEKLGAEKATSIYLLQLFPQSPAKLAAKIAGLPRPENCL
ncbi:MAG: TusE/DsrC/DsvC family sulfur relay protein [Venatoribacter sp.]